MTAPVLKIDVAPGFIPFWLGQGKSCAEILAIAGLTPRKNGRAA